MSHFSKSSQLTLSHHFHLNKNSSHFVSTYYCCYSRKIKQKMKQTYFGITGTPPELPSELGRSLFDGLEGICGLAGGCAGDGRCGGALTDSLAGSLK